MANEIKKYKITQLQEDDTLLELHPESDADIINVKKGSDAYPGNATNVQKALEEMYGMAVESGVTGVKGNAESTYRKGNVNLTPANIGAQPAFTDGSATIASESNGVVTIKVGVNQTSGKIANSSGSDITLGTAAKKGVATSISSSSTDNDLATAKAVNDAITSLPSPMVFKGSLGTGGTITTLPAASAANEGYTYKVITAGTYAGQAAGVGDLFICGKPEGSSSYSWILIPAGDEPEGTVTSVGVSVPTGFSVSNTPITSSGTIAITFASEYSLPTTAKQNSWDAKYNKPSDGIPKTDLASAVQTSLGKADTAYQKPTGGIPKGDLASAVQTSLGKADSAVQSITATGDATGKATVSSGAASIGLTLKASGVSAGTYSAVTVNTKGIVTAGAQMIEVGVAGQSAPSANLAVGGIFFKQI